MNRRAFTLIELLVVLVLGGIVAGAVVHVLRRQQRFFTTAASLLEQRTSLRDATGILPGELRALSAEGGDILAFSDSALDMRATIGSGLVCDTLAGRTGIVVAPAGARNEAPLAAFTTFPQSGDIAVVFDERDPERAADDDWISFDVASVTQTTTRCLGSPVIDPADAGATRISLGFAAGAQLPATVPAGAFVRVLRRVRYRFYRAGSGDWYLGYAEWAGSAFGVVQPVSGPFASYSSSEASGLSLRYFDAAGEVVADGDARRIARVEIKARGMSRGALFGAGTPLTDSQAVGVQLRNE